jgi:hypothetical protein
MCAASKRKILFFAGLTVYFTVSCIKSSFSIDIMKSDPRIQTGEADITNTGVMKIDAQKFALEMPSILDFGF